MGTLFYMAIPINEVLATNLKRLMEAKVDLSTQAKLASRSGVNQKTISNYLNPQQRPDGKKGRPASAKLAEVELIAGAFGLEVWELLVPGLDPNRRPTFQPLSEQERRLYERLAEVAKEIKEAP